MISVRFNENKGGLWRVGPGGVRVSPETVYWNTYGHYGGWG